jgi:ABC-type sugar transport system substrate-binding protein
MKVWPIATATASAVLLLGGLAGARPAPVRIGVVLKGLDNPFFVAMYEGVKAESRERGARVSIRAARSLDDLAGQAAHARALVAGKNDCYVVNPISGTNLISALRRVKRPIVNVDSPIDRAAAKRAGVHVRVYIGTNDFAAGRLAGVRMASLLPDGGTVALVAGLRGSVNSQLRLKGFERGIQRTSVKVVARVVADYRRERAKRAAERILRDHPRLSGFFAANDEMALGIADAAPLAGRAANLKIIGVDGIPEALDAIRRGAITATVSQYPYVMGQMAVEACIAAARGARLPSRVDAPIELVTRSNVAQASAAFPRPFRRYADPFKRLLRSRRTSGTTRAQAPRAPAHGRTLPPANSGRSDEDPPQSARLDGSARQP